MSLILIVAEDDVAGPELHAHLREAGFGVEQTADAEYGLRKLRYERPDACVVALSAPPTDSCAFTAQARAGGVVTPIVVVAGPGPEAGMERAFQLGADDVVPRPFAVGELVARLQAALRRSRGTSGGRGPEPIRVPGLLVDPRQQRALLLDGDGRSIADPRLTRTEFRMLWVLVQQPGRVLTRDELQQRVWNVPYRPRNRSVDVAVKKLRAKLELPSQYRYLHTHFGVGYRFEAEPKPA